MSDIEHLDLLRSFLVSQASGAFATPQERSAWDGFYATHDPVIRAAARRAGVDAFDVDDLAQEVWLRLTRDLLSFTLDPDRGTLGGWVATVARRCSHKMARRRSWRRNAALDDEFAASLLDPRESPFSGFEEEEYRRQLRDARATVSSGLTELGRQILDMRLEQEKSALEIASALSVSEGAVKMRLYRALRDIRHLLRKQGLVPA